jgi:hypothetical protein
MSVFWLQPLAWWGLAAVLLPILIHLLVRHQSRRVPFPSLRFLRTSRLAALHRRMLADWPLLIVRVLILATAAAAFAAPVLVTSARREAWNQRTARAIVVPPTTVQTADVLRAVEEERRDTFASATFGTLLDAESWLQHQPPAKREIVIAGDIRDGTLSEADVNSIPYFAGIRFLPFPSPPPERVRLMGVAAAAGETAAPYVVDVTVAPRHSELRYQPDATAAVPAVEVRAAAAQQDHANAVLRAVLAEGVLFGRERGRSVAILFAGAEREIAEVAQPASQLWMREALEQLSDLRGGERQGALAVVAEIEVTQADAPRLIARVLGAAFAEPLDLLEPAPIAPEVLAAWSRPPGQVPADAAPVDEGDRRWFWGAVLILLAIEWRLRRSPAGARPTEHAEDVVQEARIA